MVTVAPFEGAPSEWDNFAQGQAGYTHFHRWGWKRVLEKVFGHQCLYLGSREQDGRLSGVLPLVRVEAAFVGHDRVSMPSHNYGGPWGGAESVRALADEAVNLAGAGGVKLLEL